MKFDEIISSPKPVLVDFHADWCGPCHALAPTIKEYAQQMSGKIKVIKVDIDKNKKAATQFGIKSIPTLILFKNGRVVWKKTGVLTMKQLVAETSGFAS
jgi:thioredoxin 1